MKLVNGMLYPIDYNILPWEPEISEQGYAFVMGEYRPNKNDCCDECRRPLPENFAYLVSTGDNGFCSFECLQVKAAKYPCFYNVISTI